VNGKQKTVIIIGAIALIVSAFYPVWSVGKSQFEYFNMRRCLYSEGKTVASEIVKRVDESTAQLFALTQTVKIDYHRMMVEWAVILMLVVAAVMVLNNSGKERPMNPSTRVQKPVSKKTGKFWYRYFGIHTK
jgi:hypothetical protein